MQSYKDIYKDQHLKTFSPIWITVRMRQFNLLLFGITYLKLKTSVLQSEFSMVCFTLYDV